MQQFSKKIHMVSLHHDYIKNNNGCSPALP